MIPRRFALVAVAPVILLGGCGGDDDSSERVENQIRDQIEVAIGASLPPGVTVPDLDDLEELTGISLPDDVDDLDDMSLPDVDFDPVGSGSCSVDVTGDVSASWTEQQNTSSALVSEWLTDEQIGFFGDEFSLLFNCVGDGGSLSVFTASGVTPEQIPQAPAEYPLRGGGLVGDEEHLWSLLLTLDDSDTNWAVAEPGGTLTVVEYDDDSIEIEIDAPLYDSLARVTGSPEQTAQMTASLHVTR